MNQTRSSIGPGSSEQATAENGGEAVYYVVRVVESESVCVARGDQLRCSAGGLVIGAECEVVEGGVAQQAVIIGVGSESAINVLENCLKQPPLAPANAASDSHPATTSDDQPSPADQPSVTGPSATKQTDTASITRDTAQSEDGAPRGAVGGSGQGGQKGAWTSELAALLSPATSLSPSKPSLVAKATETGTSKSAQKRPLAVATETPTPKKNKVEVNKSPVVVRAAPTVVPARPQVPTSSLVREDKSSLPKKLSRKIESPIQQLEKTDTLSLILHELRELKRCYSTLAGSLLIIRRSQDLIKSRLSDIGLSVVTNSSDPLILTSDPSPGKVTPLDHHDDSAGELDHVEVVVGDPDHPHTLQGIDLPSTFPEFDPEYLIVSRGKSCSRRNFAVNLVRYLFTPEEMAQSNCSGTRGKTRLEQERLAIVRRTTMTLWPVEGQSDERGEWAKCIYSIDEACRRLNRPKLRKKSQLTEDELALEGEGFMEEEAT